MSSQAPEIEDLVHREYEHGFVTDVEADTVPPGLNEDVIRLISAKKGEPEFLLKWRLESYRHWLTMSEPVWAHVDYNPIDYQSISYYSAPKSGSDGPKSLDEVDPKLLETYEKLGIPLAERARLAGVAVDAVFDSVSVATTFKDTLAEQGIIFGSFSEAVKDHPALIEQYLGTVVPHTDNYFAALGLHGRLLRLHPQGRALPHGAVHLLPHQRRQHRPVRAYPADRRRGRLRELPRRLHRAHARREPAARRGGGADRVGRRPDKVLHGAELVPGRRARRRRHLQLRHQARRLPRQRFENILDPG